MRRKFAAVCLMCVLFFCTVAAGETLPIYHAPLTGSGMPYETVTYLAEPPFDPDAALLRVDVVGIRQGDCIVIRCGGQTMLMDGGEGIRYQIVTKYLQTQGIDHFDYFYLTHAHDDHTQIQQALIRHDFPVDEVLTPYNPTDQVAQWQQYRREMEAKQVPYRRIATGDVITLGDATLTVYRNDAENIGLNNHSATAMLQYGEARMFLSGDIAAGTQRWLLETFGAETFKCDIYKFAHHSNTPSVPEFLDALDPGLCINTNMRNYVMEADRQQGRRHIPRYYISAGTICCATDGSQWYVWVEKTE